MRVGGFDPIAELARLESPAGKPLAIAFDEGSDSLTVVTARGLIRTWNGCGPIDVGKVPVPGPARVVKVAPPSGETP